MELYGEHGYDNVTVTQIAERAGITRRSYFRYFPDKREVLFAGSDRLPVAVADAVLASDVSESPLSAVLAAVGRVGAQLVELVEGSGARRAVIASSVELQERERTKFAAVTAAIRDALEQRGVESARARLVAQVAVVVFQNAFDQWVDGRGKRDFGSCLDAVSASLRDTVAGPR
ncbi:MAG TPA: helix-turn-helix domain-containing protein [Amycolatopsis sp.]